MVSHLLVGRPLFEISVGWSGPNEVERIIEIGDLKSFVSLGLGSRSE